MQAIAKQNHCARCGAAIPADAPMGQCPRCLLNLTDVPGAGAEQHPPDWFGNYELIRLLGRGAMGVVYEATDTKLRRRVALKLILDTQAASPVVRRRFTIEAEAAAKLDHPNIVPIYEVGEWEGQPFLSMKLVQGSSLRDKIAAGELGARANEGSTGSGTVNRGAETAARLLLKTARAVQHAHEHGVLHRDLKPANVLIDAQGEPLLTDFGLAKLLDETPPEGGLAPATLSGSILGTPSYMSPEQAAGCRLSAAADVYALGAILYELLTGRPPFKGASAIETMRMVAEQEPRRARAIRSRIPRDLDTICMKCLEKDPERRYPSAGALADDLERWVERRPISAAVSSNCTAMRSLPKCMPPVLDYPLRLLRRSAKACFRSKPRTTSRCSRNSTRRQLRALTSSRMRTSKNCETTSTRPFPASNPGEMSVEPSALQPPHAVPDYSNRSTVGVVGCSSPGY